MTASPGSGGGSLGKARTPPGELRRMVAHWLSTHPGSHAVGDISSALGHSGGAVGQALDALKEQGAADLVPGSSPRRYRATGKTAEAAAVRVIRRGPGSSAKPKAAHRDRQPYHPRRLAGMSDVTALRKLRAARLPVMLYGPRGTGKTALAEAAFPDLIVINGDGDTQVGDIVGDWTTAPDKSFRWVNGPLVRAMQEGRPLFIDDATVISPTVLAVVYPAMDGRGEIIVKTHEGETVTAAPGFYVLAGHNPGVHGAVLSPPLASRFAVHIEVSTDYDLARSIGIDRRAVDAAESLDEMRKKGEISDAPQFRELVAYAKTARALGEEAAVANLAGLAAPEDRDAYSAALEKAFARPLVEPLALGRHY